LISFINFLKTIQDDNIMGIKWLLQSTCVQRLNNSCCCTLATEMLIKQTTTANNHLASEPHKNSPQYKTK